MKTVATPMPALRPRWKRLLVDSALARIVIFILMLGALLAMTHGVVVLLGWHLPDAPRPLRIAGYLMRQIIPSVGAYLLLVYGIERRRPDELAWRKLLPHGAAGLLGGALFIGSVMAVLTLAGAYRITGTNVEVRWATSLLVAGLGTAIAEEIVFRGVLYRISEEALGMWWALLISALFFGAAHLGNSGATLWTSFAIAIEAGVLLGVVYHATRSLPVCMGVHMAWNFLEGFVFGSPVSGEMSKFNLVVAEFPGPDWLTGGKFGIEGSVVTVAISLIFSALLLAAQKRRAAHNARVPPGVA